MLQPIEKCCSTGVQLKLEDEAGCKDLACSSSSGSSNSRMLKLVQLEIPQLKIQNAGRQTVPQVVL